MLDKTFNFSDIVQGMKNHKEAYQQTYEEKLKSLFDKNPGEVAGLFLVRLKLYKKILGDIDNKIENSNDFSDVVSGKVDSDAKSFIRGRMSAFLEMRDYIDNRLCKLNNMADCIQKNNPEIAEAMIKERVT